MRGAFGVWSKIAYTRLRKTYTTNSIIIISKRKNNRSKKMEAGEREETTYISKDILRVLTTALNTPKARPITHISKNQIFTGDSVECSCDAEGEGRQ